MHSAWFVVCVLVVLALILAAWMVLRRRGAVPVLMYHKVDPERRDALTVSTSQLEQQLAWLVAKGYRAVPLDEMLEAVQRGRAPAGRPVLLTFDDAYVSVMAHALPLLRQYGMTAALFVPSAYIGGRNEWDGSDELLMDAEQLRSLAPIFTLALHSHRHPRYRQLDAAAVRADLADNIAAVRASGLPFLPAFAYPYGGRPKDPATKAAMREAMREAGISLAFRIGGRLNRFPVRDPLEVQRIDVHGSDSLRSFARKIMLGRVF